MKYKIYLDENDYLTGFEHTGTEADTFELDPTAMSLDYLNCYHLVDGSLWFDEEKYEEVVKEQEEEEKHSKEISEQTLRLAELFVTNGINADDFLDRLDAQVLYTSLMTDTLLPEEDDEDVVENATTESEEVE